MITTKRSLIENDFTIEENNASVGVGLLERSESRTRYFAPEKTETAPVDEERQRRQRNLHKLLNYDRVVEEKVEVVEKATLDEDIRPTSTTLQFGGDNGEQLLKELNVADTAVKTEEKQSYRLSSKGKLVAVIYALVVSVIVALIIINTNVLAKLNNKVETSNTEANVAMREYLAVKDKIDAVSGNDYVIDVAQNQLGMVLGE